MKDLTNLAGKPGEQFNQGAIMSAGTSDPPYDTAPGSAPVNPVIGPVVNDPQMEVPANKDLTHMVSANAVGKSPANWKKAGE